MTKIEKYKFDNELDQLQIDNDKFNSELISEAFEKGRQQGRNETELELDTTQQETLDAISKSLQNAIASMNLEILRIENEAINMTNELVKIYTASIFSKDPSLAIMPIIKRATEAIGNAPTLCISVGPILSDEIRSTILKLIEDAGFSGAISITENRNLANGDIEIEWPQGGFRYSQHDINDIVEKIIKAHNR